ncbi:MAG: hypothetical protein AAF919_17265 [Pseudomonadota bacterium]
MKETPAHNALLPWQLSGRDNQLLRRLHATLWSWLPDLADGEAVKSFGRLLDAVERLMADGAPPPGIQADCAFKPDGADGVGVAIDMAPEAVMLHATRYVWGAVGRGLLGHDHGAVLDEDGRPLLVFLTPQGSFDTAAFETWLDLADEVSEQRHEGNRSRASVTAIG